MLAKKHLYWLVLKNCGYGGVYRKGEVVKSQYTKTFNCVFGGRHCSPAKIKEWQDRGYITNISKSEAIAYLLSRIK